MYASSPLLLLVVVALLDLTSVTAWVNDYDQPFTWQCPGGQSISRVDSQHDNRREDRLFDFTCRGTPVAGPQTDCYWTGFLNEFDGILANQCDVDRYIAGIGSYHDNQREDRRFRYYCCHTISTYLHDCRDTDWLNNFDAYFSYTLPANTVLKGITSYHDDRTEDRRFKFNVCSMTRR